MKNRLNYGNDLKRIVLGFLLLLVVRVGFSQNSYPATSDAKLDGYSLRFEIPVTSGGWARGGHFYNPAGTTKWGGVGMYGVGTTQERIYLAHGSSPHASTLGMQILSSGNVGIGTFNPAGKLQIHGSDGEQQQGQVHIVGNGEPGPGDAYISFYEGGESNSKWSLGARDNGNAFTISHGLTMDAAPKFVITDVVGNVGIGTPNPQGKLHVKGDSGEQAYGQIHVQGNGGSGSGDAYISFHEGAEPDSKWAIGAKDNGNAFSISKGSTMDSDPKFMIFETTGNVAIGTSYTGNHKLAVGGSIGAREIKVEAGTWSDFVFYKGYNLPSLQEVERHISEKGHLQNIPSEKEVKENGINLGEMDAKLLQKIEELMLYTIQQQKEIEALKTLNISLVKDIQSLKLK